MRAVFLITFIVLLIGPIRAFASQWYLVKVESAELYSADAAYRLEASLVQTASEKVAVWVRTDYLRPKGYQYPKEPRAGQGNAIQTDAYLWEKERFVVDCRAQQIQIQERSYMLAGENIEWENSKTRVISVSPDSIAEVVFKIVCVNQIPRPFSDIESIARTVEQTIVPDPQEQEYIRRENNVPQVRF